MITEITDEVIERLIGGERIIGNNLKIGYDYERFWMQNDKITRNVIKKDEFKMDLMQILTARKSLEWEK